MAPITDQAVDELKSLVAKLEKRVLELESKAGLSTGRPALEQMRLVLMGPPGAGKLTLLLAIESKHC
jgi:adenylate kinase